MKHQVRGTRSELTPDLEWESPFWEGAETLQLSHHLGPRPGHFPRTQIRLQYDDTSLHVIFRVEDCYVRAVAGRHQGEVWKDSCVEFFFTPFAQVSGEYMNLEINCAGLARFAYQSGPRTGRVGVEADDIERLGICTTMTGLVEQEVAEPTVWMLRYALPFSLIRRYCPRTVAPSPGVTWRANFYKCADACSHPHWLTWAPISAVKPDFHRPDCFGMLEFV